MGLFSGRKEGGFMDVIRCDEQEYLVWKWRPSGNANSTKKENAIRYGSSLRVKDGELAVFVYKQKDGAMQDYIEGPYDQTIKTANFPILTSIVGAAFGGASPFQAEIYFINLSGNIQIRFGVPFFDVFDPRYPDHPVPIAVRGTITFNIADYKEFIKLNRLIDFDLDSFEQQVKSAVVKNIKGIVINIPSDNGIPVVQMERKILELNDLIEGLLRKRFISDFGVNLKALDISSLEIDKESSGYKALQKITAMPTEQTVQAQTAVNIKNLHDMQNINSENMRETLRVQREESQRAQKLQTESNFIGAHALNQQADVLKTGAQNLGQMGSIGGDMNNPAGMMTGMMMGGAIGNQMAGMMNNMGQTMQNSMNTPPPIPQIQYMVSANGQQTGPYSIDQLRQLVHNGQMNNQTYVWKQGMSNWELAGNITELHILFNIGAPVPPPMPPQF